MKGLELKKILCNDGIRLSELAKSLGFDNDQRLHSALNAGDVKSGLIEKIAKATNKSVGYYYGEDTQADNTAVLLEMLRKRDQQIDRLMALLEKQNNIYMSAVAEP